jgi:methyl-accepting chemotaxis protein
MIIQIEHSKGFAEVAEEVRTLAIRTTEASKIIRELLKTMHGKVISITCSN